MEGDIHIDDVMMEVNAVITGVTGMVGEGVLYECLNHSSVNKILAINRRPCDVQHEKLEEIIHDNFFDFDSIREQLREYNACYFCMGVSSVRMKEEKYHNLTYDITMALANTFVEVKPNGTFCRFGCRNRQHRKGSIDVGTGKRQN